MTFFGSSDFEKILERATSDELLEPDLAINTELCDVLRQREVKATTALNAIIKKIGQRKPMVTLLALTVLEMCVSNCGPYFAREVATENFMNQMREWALPSSFSEQISYRLLEIIQNWAVGFKGDGAYQKIFDTYHRMRMEGFQFPECRVTEAMFRVDQAPEWLEGDQCYNCRTYFGPITRKHHCRNCGQIFCNSCSSYEAAIPKYGYEKAVRVCSGCHTLLQNGQHDSKSVPQNAVSTSEYGKVVGGGGEVPSSAAEGEALRQREEDELMQAIAQSLHIQELQEQKIKEQQRLYEQHSYASTAASGSMDDHTQESSDEDSSEDSDVDKPSSTDKQSHKSREEDSDDVEVSNPDLAAYLKSAKDARTCKSANLSNSANGQSETAVDPVSLASVQSGNEFMDPDDSLIRGLGASLKLFDSKMKNAQALNRNVKMDSTTQSLRTSLLAMQPQLLNAMERNDSEKLVLLEVRARVQRIIDTRNKLIETRRKHREEQELLERMQLEQKLKLMQQQEQYQRYQQNQYQMQFASNTYLPYGTTAPGGPAPHGLIPQQYNGPPPPQEILQSQEHVTYHELNAQDSGQSNQSYLDGQLAPPQQVQQRSIVHSQINPFQEQSQYVSSAETIPPMQIAASQPQPVVAEAELISFD
eukprot:CFRG3548T1